MQLFQYGLPAESLGSDSFILILEKNLGAFAEGQKKTNKKNILKRSAVQNRICFNTNRTVIILTQNSSEKKDVMESHCSCHLLLPCYKIL